MTYQDLAQMISAMSTEEKQQQVSILLHECEDESQGEAHVSHKIGIIKEEDGIDCFDVGTIYIDVTI